MIKSADTLEHAPQVQREAKPLPVKQAISALNQAYAHNRQFSLIVSKLAPWVSAPLYVNWG